MSILDREVAATPFAVFALETTGLSVRGDRIVEVAVVHVAGSQTRTTALDTLVNPQRPVTGQEIHGITDEDVAPAPTFSDIAQLVVAGLVNRVLVSHNVTFDMAILKEELVRSQYIDDFPHISAMSLTQMSHEGQGGVDGAMTALERAESGARLLQEHIGWLAQQGLRTFRDLAALEGESFLESFLLDPLPPPPAGFETDLMVPRDPITGEEACANPAMRRYLDAVVDAVADLRITEEELRYVQELQHTLGIPVEEICAVHARVFVGMLERFIEDRYLDEAERLQLNALWSALSVLGWAPGE